MGFIKGNLLLVSDSNNNINLFRLLNGEIICYHFNNESMKRTDMVITTEALQEYDCTIDVDNMIYVVYQDKELNLILALFNEEQNAGTIRLNEKPMPEMYYLRIILDNGKPHIFYYVCTSWDRKIYRIYHHYYTGEEWKTYIIKEVRIREFLNPLWADMHNNQIFVMYYNQDAEEQICMRKFSLMNETWGSEIKLTDNEQYKIYLDSILLENKVHLAYCQYHERNLVTKYQSFTVMEDSIIKEYEMELSNPGNSQEPIIIYYQNDLWIIWIEYENVMSRYSKDYGKTWSPLYLWRESKGKNIVKYKYVKYNDKDIIRHSFGLIEPCIRFIGFGPTQATIEVP